MPEAVRCTLLLQQLLLIKWLLKQLLLQIAAFHATGLVSIYGARYVTRDTATDKGLIAGFRAALHNAPYRSRSRHGLISAGGCRGTDGTQERWVFQGLGT